METNGVQGTEKTPAFVTINLSRKPRDGSSHSEEYVGWCSQLLNLRCSSEFRTKTLCVTKDCHAEGIYSRYKPSPPSGFPCFNSDSDKVLSRLTASEDLSPKMVAFEAITILGCTSKSFLTSSTAASSTFAREKPFLLWPHRGKDEEIRSTQW